MIFTSFGSSSRGNCYHVSDGSSQILIEAGIHLNKLRNHISLADLDGCLITHEHGDHARFAAEVARFTPIYASSGTLSKLYLDRYVYNKRELKAKEQFKIGTFSMVPFDVEHDAEEPFGYLVYSKKTKKKLLFATDTPYIKHKFKGLTHIAIECNYSSEIVKKNLENGMNEVRAKRLFATHFELSNVIKFLKSQDLSKVEVIYLLHLSDGNSDAELFKREVQKATGVVVKVCES